MIDKQRLSEDYSDLKVKYDELKNKHQYASILVKKLDKRNKELTIAQEVLTEQVNILKIQLEDYKNNIK